MVTAFQDPDLVAVLVGVEEEGAVELGHPLAPDLHRHLVPHLDVEEKINLISLEVEVDVDVEEKINPLKSDLIINEEQLFKATMMIQLVLIFLNLLNFLTQFSPSGLSNGFPGLLGFPPGVLHVIGIIILSITFIMLNLHPNIIIAGPHLIIIKITKITIIIIIIFMKLVIIKPTLPSRAGGRD